jgi:hypothetical protein
VGGVVTPELEHFMERVIVAQMFYLFVGGIGVALLITIVVVTIWDKRRKS